MIRLRALTVDDADATWSFRNDPETKALFLGNVMPNSLSQERQWLSGLPGLEPRTISWGVENTQRELVGFCQIKHIDYFARHGEFSILVGPDYRGNGFGKAATEAVLAYCFGSLNLRKVYLYVSVTNQRAAQLYASLGFQKVGTLKEHAYRDGKYLDVDIMEIFKKD
ncbi:MAG: hypothetical protein A2X49_03560 [Lentisphaerae bacterium GWF2_52_8]|nr:MAG: hypothetical protein A2X49_03560 [Lentisphaerae bacterium GWF2_52_8]